MFTIEFPLMGVEVGTFNENKHPDLMILMYSSWKVLINAAWHNISYIVKA